MSLLEFVFVFESAEGLCAALRSAAQLTRSLPAALDEWTLLKGQRLLFRAFFK